MAAGGKAARPGAQREQRADDAGYEQHQAQDEEQPLLVEAAGHRCGRRRVGILSIVRERLTPRLQWLHVQRGHGRCLLPVRPGRKARLRLLEIRR